MRTIPEPMCQAARKKKIMNNAKNNQIGSSAIFINIVLFFSNIKLKVRVFNILVRE